MDGLIGGGWNQDGDGFTFFLNRKEAVKLKKLIKDYSWGMNSVIRQIEFKRGICKQDEDNIIDNIIFKTALCKSFKILNGDKKNV